MSTEVLNGGTPKIEIAKIAEGSQEINLVYNRGESGYVTISVCKPIKGNNRDRTKPMLGMFSGSIREIAKAAREQLEHLSPSASAKTIRLYRSSEDVANDKPIFTLEPQNKPQK